MILSSFPDGAYGAVDASHCLYRTGHDAAASSYIVRSGATGSRTIVNFNDLPEMTAGELEGIVDALTGEVGVVGGGGGGGGDGCWWHFEVSTPLQSSPYAAHKCMNAWPGKGKEAGRSRLTLRCERRAGSQRQRSSASATSAKRRRVAPSASRSRSLTGTGWSSSQPRRMWCFTREAGLK